MNKVFLQISLERNFLNLLYISFFSVNFKNLINESHVPCVLNIHIKFHLNQIVGSQIVAHTQMETGDGPNKPNTMNL